MATVKKIKKAQVGVKEKMSKDSSGYTYTKEVNRPEGKRYYQGASPDQSTAMKIASFKATNSPSDSVRTTVLKKEKAGGKVAKAKDGKWIQKAINPKHKGFCTPETKATCTPRRKALAHTLRKMSKKK